jgi:Flp pilus assembly protein TadD
LLNQYRQRVAPTRPQENAATGAGAFPFEIYSTGNIALLKQAFKIEDIPYQPRRTPEEQREFQAAFDTPRLLLLGRTGLGKTRESIESIIRLSEVSGQEITVLSPKTQEFDRPAPRHIPAGFSPKFVVLFVDAIEGVNVGTGGPGNDLDEKSFHERLSSTISWLEECYGDRGCRVILTSIDYPETASRLRFDSGLLATFKQLRLRQIHREARPNFAAAIAGHLGFSLTPGAVKYISERSDSTPAGILMPLKWERGLSRQSWQLTTEELSSYRFEYPWDWEKRIYENIIAKMAERKAAFDALSLIDQAGILTHDVLVEGLALKLDTRYLPQWIKRRRIQRALQQDLASWVYHHQSMYLCAKAYLRQQQDTANAPSIIIDIYKSAVRKIAPSAAMLDIPVMYRLALQYNIVDDVVNILDILSKRTLNPAKFLTAISRLRLHQGSPSEALAYASRAVAADPTDFVAQIHLAGAQSANGLISSAVATAREAAQLAPQDDFAWLNYGVILSKVDEAQSAIFALREACKLNPLNDRAWNALGIALDRAGQVGEAEMACMRAVSLNPTNADFRHTLGILYDRAGRPAKAITALAAAIYLAPSQRNLIALARAQRKAGWQKAASKTASRIVERAIDSGDDLVSVAWVLGVNGLHEEAAVLARRLIEEDPGNVSAARAFAHNFLPMSHDDRIGFEPDRAAARKEITKGIDWLRSPSSSAAGPVAISEITARLLRSLINEDEKYPDRAKVRDAAWDTARRFLPDLDIQVWKALADESRDAGWPQYTNLIDAGVRWLDANTTSAEWPKVAQRLVRARQKDQSLREKAIQWLEQSSVGAGTSLWLALFDTGFDRERLGRSAEKWGLLANQDWPGVSRFYEAILDTVTDAPRLLEHIEKWSLSNLNSPEGSFLLIKVMKASVDCESRIASVIAELETDTFVGRRTINLLLAALKVMEARPETRLAARLATCHRIFSKLEPGCSGWGAAWLSLYRQVNTAGLEQLGLQWLATATAPSDEAWPSAWLQLQNHGASPDAAMRWLRRLNAHGKWVEVWWALWRAGEHNQILRPLAGEWIVKMRSRRRRPMECDTLEAELAALS